MSCHPVTSSLIVSLSLVLCAPSVAAQDSAAGDETCRYGAIATLTQLESLESRFFDRRGVLRVRSEPNALLSNNP